MAGRQPTARQAVEDVQDTPLNWASVAGLGEFCCTQPAQAGWAVVSAIAAAIATVAKWRQVTAAPRPLTNLVIILHPLVAVGRITRPWDHKGIAGNLACVVPTQFPA